MLKLNLILLKLFFHRKNDFYRNYPEYLKMDFKRKSLTFVGQDTPLTFATAFFLEGFHNYAAARQPFSLSQWMMEVIRDAAPSSESTAQYRWLEAWQLSCNISC